MATVSRMDLTTNVTNTHFWRLLFWLLLAALQKLPGLSPQRSGQWSLFPFGVGRKIWHRSGAGRWRGSWPVSQEATPTKVILIGLIGAEVGVRLFISKGIDIRSGAPYKGLKSSFGNSIDTSDFDPYGISKNYNINFLCKYEILNKLFYQKKYFIYDLIAISNHFVFL